MSNIEFTGTSEERQRQGEIVLTQIHRDLYGNGTQGILARIEASMIKTATEDAIREKQHKENQERLAESHTRQNLMLTGIGVVIAILGLNHHVSAIVHILQRLLQWSLQ